MFADSLGVKLTLLIPDSFDDLLQKITDGSAHLAAAGLTVTKNREKIYRFGPGYQEITENNWFITLLTSGQKTCQN